MIDTLTSTVMAQDRKLDELAQDNRDLRDRIRNLSQNLHAAQNRKLDVLVQNNGHLRDELRHLSQTVQSSKKDIQRVENISNNMASELKGKLEYMLEKSENRILGPVNRLSEELERMRANPPPAPPVPVPGGTAFPSTAPYPPEPPAGESEWTSPDDYTPTESNKPHYQESWGNYRVRLTSQSSQTNLIFNRHSEPQVRQGWLSSLPGAWAWVTRRLFRESTSQPKTLLLTKPRRVGAALSGPSYALYSRVGTS